MRSLEAHGIESKTESVSKSDTDGYSVTTWPSIYVFVFHNVRVVYRMFTDEKDVQLLVSVVGGGELSSSNAKGCSS